MTIEIQQIYENAHARLMAFTEIFNETDNNKDKFENLSRRLITQEETGERSEISVPVSVIDMKLSESSYPFTNRMSNMLDELEICTVADLIVIPLGKYVRFKGFKRICVKQLIGFIEFEGIGHLFKGYNHWKIAMRRYIK